MEKVTNDTEGTLGERILFAFEQDFYERYPDCVLTPGFREMILHYISLGSNIGTTNAVEQMIKGFKAIYKNNITINAAINYLNSTDFRYKPMIHKNEHPETT